MDTLISGLIVEKEVHIQTLLERDSIQLKTVIKKTNQILSSLKHCNTL